MRATIRFKRENFGTSHHESALPQRWGTRWKARLENLEFDNYRAKWSFRLEREGGRLPENDEKSRMLIALEKVWRTNWVQRSHQLGGGGLITSK